MNSCCGEYSHLSTRATQRLDNSDFGEPPILLHDYHYIRRRIHSLYIINWASAINRKYVSTTIHSLFMRAAPVSNKMFVGLSTNYYQGVGSYLLQNLALTKLR